jgi:hypothetical protein
MRGVVIYFNAEPNATTIIQIDRSKPIREPSTGRWLFNSQPVQVTPTLVKSKSQGALAQYIANIFQLLQNTSYNYIITVPGSGPTPLQQEVGSFKTPSMTVKVVFTEIYLVSDGDADSAGDLQFDFTINPDDRSGLSTRRLGDSISSPLNWESGERHKIYQEFLIPVAPDRLRILVKGHDYDGPIGGGFGSGCLLKTSDIPITFDNVQPSNVCGWETNVAKGEFDLNQSPGDRTGLSFALRSAPLGPHGSTLMFDVRGYAEIYRNVPGPQ